MERHNYKATRRVDKEDEADGTTGTQMKGTDQTDGGKRANVNGMECQ